ncbi:hypothetical protein [Streptomyces chryseus]
MNRYQIEAPVRSFSGESVGVSFQRGTGYVTDATKEGRAALEYFRRHNYGVSLAEEKTLEERVQDLVTGPAAAGGSAYDPAEHSVEDVLAYLDEADHDEAQRVLDAEAAGKDRVTITKLRDEILAAKTTPAVPAGDSAKGAKK